MSETEATAIRVISTDTLKFPIMLGHRGGVYTWYSNRKTLTMGIVVPYGGLTDTLNTRVRLFETTHCVDVRWGCSRFSREGRKRFVASGRC